MNTVEIVPENNYIKIDLKVGDQLTSISCGHIVVELIKFIVYQRQQIPYTYPWLKHVINKRKSCDEEFKETLQSERHYRDASRALENLDFILKSLLVEINGSTIPDEICIALGGTPVMCKEVYRLYLPTVCHKPQCQSTLIATDKKIHMTVFKSLVEKLSQFTHNHISPTNMYVYIKKKIIGCQEAVISGDTFEDTNGYRIPRTSKIVVIDLRPEDYHGVSCCNSFKIFGDISTGNTDSIDYVHEDVYEIESTDTSQWYQSSYVMKGFKDCIVNGSSITNTWLNS